MLIHRSRTGAAALSFVLPGLGQLWLGARGRGVALAAVPVALAVAAAAVLLLDPIEDVVAALLEPSVLLALFVANALVGLYRLAAIADAFRLRRASGAPVGRSRGAPLALAAILIATVAMHAVVGYLAYGAYETSVAVFRPDGGGSAVIPEPSFSPDPTVVPSPTPGASSSSSAEPPATPTPVPVWARDGRLDLLLVGADSGPERTSLRTDTMVILRVDATSGRAAFVGIPRNLVGVPLPPESARAFANGRFPDLLNALYRYAMEHPAAFPGGENRGWRAVSGAVQELTHVRLDGLVVVNLAGFVRLVDAVGGLWIHVPSPLYDSHYPLEDGSRDVVVRFSVGCQHLDGRMALAYARSRHQDSDYGRMARQQLVLAALRRQLDPVALVPRVPELLAIARDTLWTSIPRSEVADLAAFARRVDASRIRSLLLTPPTYSSVLDRAEIVRIQRAVAGVLDLPPSKSVGGGGTAPRCPAG